MSVRTQVSRIRSWHLDPKYECSSTVLGMIAKTWVSSKHQHKEPTLFVEQHCHELYYMCMHIYIYIYIYVCVFTLPLLHPLDQRVDGSRVAPG